MKARYDIQLMVQVSKMYYLESMTQQHIAKELGISRSAISMILTEAKTFGVVEIKVNDPKDNITSLSDEFEKVFSLKSCYVMPTSIDAPSLITRIVASKGADLVEEMMHSVSTIGIAWGSTCYEVMRSFNVHSKLNSVNVVPLIGGTARITSEYQLNEMVRIFAENVHGTPVFIHAPAIAESIIDKDLYMKSGSMKSIKEMWSKMDVAVISAGAPPEYYFSNEVDDPEEMKLVYDSNRYKAVGDICARRLNIYGEFLDNDYNSRVMGIDEESLRDVKDVICIASGKAKVLSIIGALRTKIVDHFVTDEKTARQVLDIMNMDTETGKSKKSSK